MGTARGASLLSEVKQLEQQIMDASKDVLRPHMHLVTVAIAYSCWCTLRGMSCRSGATQGSSMFISVPSPDVQNTTCSQPTRQKSGAQALSRLAQVLQLMDSTGGRVPLKGEATGSLRQRVLEHRSGSSRSNSHKARIVWLLYFVQLLHLRCHCVCTGPKGIRLCP